MKSRQDFDSYEDYRDYLLHYYAGQALQGLMANPERYKYVVDRMNDADTRQRWTQEDATRHNSEKALFLAEGLLTALGYSKD